MKSSILLMPTDVLTLQLHYMYKGMLQQQYTLEMLAVNSH